MWVRLRETGGGGGWVDEPRGTNAKYKSMLGMLYRHVVDDGNQLKNDVYLLILFFYVEINAIHRGNLSYLFNGKRLKDSRLGGLFFSFSPLFGMLSFLFKY